ncbi:MAG: transposase [Nitrososphaerales archaeon]
MTYHQTGCQWKALPGEFVSAATSNRRFQQWVGESVFEKISIKLLKGMMPSGE